MQNVFENKFTFQEPDEVHICDWDIDFLFFSGQCEDLFSISNTLLNQFKGSIYKNSMHKKVYSSEKKRSVNVIGNLGLKYTFGFEEDCGFSYVEKLATSDIKNEGFSILARFMKENFPKRKVLVFGHGQKDEAISFEQINTILTNYGPVEVALAAHLKDKKPGNQF